MIVGDAVFTRRAPLNVSQDRLHENRVEEAIYILEEQFGEVKEIIKRNYAALNASY
ncbi:MAG: hypothetical protein STSR0009_10960 [Methanoregula sp.]